MSSRSLCVLFALSSTAFGQLFVPAAGSPYVVGSGADGAATGDFNSDGNLDVATPNRFGNSVSVMLGNGAGGFTNASGSPFASGNGSARIASADFNLDGKLDLAVYNATDSQVRIYLGAGNGTFTQAAGSPYAGGGAPVPGDFDGNNVPDLAIPNQAAGNITLLLGNGAGGFAAASNSPFTAGAGVIAIATGDFNRDGRRDLAAANFTAGTITVLLGNGLGSFVPAAGSGFAAGTNPAAIVSGDVNRDGREDFVVANQGSNNVQVFLGDGTGGFSQAAGSPIAAATAPSSLALRDLDGDSAVDLVVASSATAAVNVLRNTGGGGFAVITGSPFATAGGPGAVAVSDYNGDGRPDVIAVSPSVSQLTLLVNNMPFFRFQPRELDFYFTTGQTGAQNLGTILGGNAGVTASINSDNPWLTYSVGCGGLCISASALGLNAGQYRGQLTASAASTYSGTLLATMNIANQSLALTPPSSSPFSVGDGARALAAGDFNRDGNPDLAVTSTTLNSVAVLLGNGSGGFSAAAGSPFATGQRPETMVAADFNGDGKLDLATANALSDDVSILLGTGTGSFLPIPGQVVAAGTTPSAIAAADFNRDGLPDLATVNRNGGSVSILLNNGTGSFSATAPISSLASPRFLVAGDFNGDGDGDLAVALEASLFNVYLGNGRGGFTLQPGSPYTIDFQPSWMATGDVNADGRLDILTVTSGSGALRVHLGNGLGGFSPAPGSPFATATAPSVVAAADVNGDGKVDALVSHSNNNGATVMLGNGTGGFAQAPGTFPATNGQTVATGDFNKDGFPDFAHAISTGTVRVFLGGKASTSTSLVSNPLSAAVFGQTITLTATVTAAPGSVLFGSFGGAVRFFDNGTQIGNSPIAGGTATLTLPTLPPGTHIFTATYVGDSTANPSSSSSVNVAVNNGNLALQAGNGQFAVVTDTFLAPLQVLVTNHVGAPVSGALVSFFAPGNGASGTFEPSGLNVVRVPTNAQGVASAPTLRANSVAGIYSVIAATPGVNSTASFTLNNVLAGSASQLIPIAGTPQIAQVGTAFTIRLKVRALDAIGRPATAGNISFSSPGSGSSGTFAGGGTSVQVATDAQGFAEAPLFTANNTAGSYNVLAALGSLQPAPFALTNQTGAGLQVIAPFEGQTINVANVTFQWSRDNAAAGYRILVKQNTGQTVFTGQLAGSASTGTVLNLPDGTFSFAVQSCSDVSLSNCNGNYGARNFTVQTPAPTAPNITFPATGAVLDTSTHTLSWAGVAGATRYEVTLRNNTTGNIDLFITTLAPDVSTIFSMRSGDYTLEVKACGAGCGPAGLSYFSVRLNPVPAAPPVITVCNVQNQINQNLLTCNWTPVAGADLYVIQVVQAGAGPGGGALTVASSQVSTTSASFQVPNGALQVVVQACNGDGCSNTSGAYGITAAFGNPSVPTMGSPVGGLTVQGPTILFSWSRLPSDNGSNTFYRLYVQDFARNQPALDILTNQNFWGAQFAAGRRYDALVIGNPDSLNASQGPPQGFTTRGNNPLSPTLVQPQHQGSIKQGNIKLGWTPLPGAQLYQYYIAAAGQNTPVATGVTTGIEVQVPLSVVNNQNTPHTGIVRACTAGLSCTAGSETGWGIWSDRPGGAGVTNFTLVP